MVIGRDRGRRRLENRRIRDWRLVLSRVEGFETVLQLVFRPVSAYNRTNPIEQGRGDIMANIHGAGNHEQQANPNPTRKRQ